MAPAYPAPPSLPHRNGRSTLSCTRDGNARVRRQVGDPLFKFIAANVERLAAGTLHAKIPTPSTSSISGMGWFMISLAASASSARTFSLIPPRRLEINQSMRIMLCRPNRPESPPTPDYPRQQRFGKIAELAQCNGFVEFDDVFAAGWRDLDLRCGASPPPLGTLHGQHRSNCIAAGSELTKFLLRSSRSTRRPCRARSCSGVGTRHSRTL